jgi:hypothetical protein
MKIKVKEIIDRVYLLEFETQYDVASTFLRFEEHYESPKFRGKFFSLKEFKKWYSRDKGRFTYYSDWGAFNLPSYILKHFYEGKFNPLSKKEKQVLKLLSKIKGDFYIIALYKGCDKDLKNHEIAHGLFYTKPKYKENVVKLLKKYDLSKIKKELKSKDGYNDAVIDDELHAWIMTSPEEIKAKIPKGLAEELNKLFNKYCFCS